MSIRPETKQTRIVLTHFAHRSGSATRKPHPASYFAFATRRERVIVLSAVCHAGLRCDCLARTKTRYRHGFFSAAFALDLMIHPRTAPSCKKTSKPIRSPMPVRRPRVSYRVRRSGKPPAATPPRIASPKSAWWKRARRASNVIACWSTRACRWRRSSNAYGHR